MVEKFWHNQYVIPPHDMAGSSLDKTFVITLGFSGQHIKVYFTTAITNSLAGK